MIELSELEILKRALPVLEGHYEMYLEERDKSNYSRLKKDREHAKYVFSCELSRALIPQHFDLTLFISS